MRQVRRLAARRATRSARRGGRSSHGAHEQLPSSSATRSFGKRSSTPPAVRLTAAAMMPSGWLKVCHIISLSKISSEKSGLQVVLAAAVEGDRDVRAARTRPTAGRRPGGATGGGSTHAGREEDRLEAELARRSGAPRRPRARRRAARPSPAPKKRPGCGAAEVVAASRCRRARSPRRSRARARRRRSSRGVSRPSTNSPRVGNSTARSRPSASIASRCEAGSQPRASALGVDALVLRLPGAAARRLSGRTAPRRRMTCDFTLHAHVALHLGEARPARRADTPDRCSAARDRAARRCACRCPRPAARSWSPRPPRTGWSSARPMPLSGLAGGNPSRSSRVLPACARALRVDKPRGPTLR